MARKRNAEVTPQSGKKKKKGSESSQSNKKKKNSDSSEKKKNNSESSKEEKNGESTQHLNVKIRLRVGEEDESVRRLSLQNTKASFTLVKNAALRMAVGSGNDYHRVKISSLEKGHRVSLHYTDNSGDKVIISSSEDLVNAFASHAVDGTLEIVARVKEAQNGNGFIVKLGLTNAGQDATIFRRLAFEMIKDDPYKSLKKEAIRLSRDMDKSAEKHAAAYQVRFHYADKDGDKAMISSAEELDDAIRQFMSAGSVKIIANVTPDESVEPMSPSPQPVMSGESLDSPFSLNQDAVQAAKQQFTDLDELKRAVDEYLADPSEKSIVARTFGYPIGRWDVSRVTSFRSLFDSDRNYDMADFNEDLEDWDVSAGRDFSCMFRGAVWFQGSLSAWNMSSAETTSAMFQGAERFNGDLSRWNVSKVLDMSHMFSRASSFRPDIKDWNVAGVKTVVSIFGDLEGLLFAHEVAGWDLSKAVDKHKMFWNSLSL